MPRDKALEALLNDHLATVPALTQKAMFGGWVWLVRGHLLCGARSTGMLVRLGREYETWAIEIPGISPAVMGARRMHGWVRATAEAYGNDSVREKLIHAALAFNRTLPRK